MFDRLAAEVAATPGARLLRQVPLVLFSIDGDRRGVPFRLTVDFAIVTPCPRTEACRLLPGCAHHVRYVEAKTRRKSREWARGAAAARAAGYQIEETDH